MSYSSASLPPVGAPFVVYRMGSDERHIAIEDLKQQLRDRVQGDVPIMIVHGTETLHIHTSVPENRLRDLDAINWLRSTLNPCGGRSGGARDRKKGYGTVPNPTELLIVTVLERAVGHAQAHYVDLALRLESGNRPGDST